MKRQFQVLYREFLFRMVDLEVLSAQGDIKQLLGQFGSILVSFSAVVALGAMVFDPRHMTPRAAVASLWSTQHFLIATTMLVMGLFAVLSWDSLSPIAAMSWCWRLSRCGRARFSWRRPRPSAPPSG